MIDGAKEIAGPLTTLINRFLDDSTFPITSSPNFWNAIERDLFQQLYDYLEKGSFFHKGSLDFDANLPPDMQSHYFKIW